MDVLDEIKRDERAMIGFASQPPSIVLVYAHPTDALKMRKKIIPIRDQAGLLRLAPAQLAARLVAATHPVLDRADGPQLEALVGRLVAQMRTKLVPAELAPTAAARTERSALAIASGTRATQPSETLNRDLLREVTDMLSDEDDEGTLSTPATKDAGASASHPTSSPWSSSAAAAAAGDLSHIATSLNPPASKSSGPDPLAARPFGASLAGGSIAKLTAAPSSATKPARNAFDSLSTLSTRPQHAKAKPVVPMGDALDALDSLSSLTTARPADAPKLTAAQLLAKSEDEQRAKQTRANGALGRSDSIGSLGSVSSFDFDSPKPSVLTSFKKVTADPLKRSASASSSAKASADPLAALLGMSDSDSDSEGGVSATGNMGSRRRGRAQVAVEPEPAERRLLAQAGLVRRRALGWAGGALAGILLDDNSKPLIQSSTVNFIIVRQELQS
jgi:hypothetical protein